MIQPQDYFKAHQGEFEADLASLIAIPSVAGEQEGKYPYGKECGKVLDCALAMGKQYGFRTENHDYHCASILYGDAEKEIGIVAHLDVVPVGDGWQSDPFKLCKKDGLYLGRGANDDKGPALIGLYAMRYLRENDVRLPFTVRLILGADEEVGSEDLEYYKSVRKAPSFSFTPDHQYPVCIGEKGIMSFTLSLGKASARIRKLSGGSVSNAVADSAYIILEGISASDCPPAAGITCRDEEGGVCIAASGQTAHASTPETGKSAIGILTAYLIENELVTDEDRRMLSFAMLAGKNYRGEEFGIGFEDTYFGYLTCVNGLISLSENREILLNFNIRYPMSKKYDELYRKVETFCAENRFTLVESNRGSAHAEGYFKSPDSPEIRALTNAAETVLAEKCEPYTMGGGTYARSLPNTVAFGALIEACRGKLGAGRGEAHDRDEYLTEEEASKGVAIFVTALRNLAKI